MKITKTKVSGLGINYKEECDQCTYCWNQDLNKRFHPNYIGSKSIDRNYAELLDQLKGNRIPKPYLEEECQFYDRGQWDIILSSKTDPFHPDCGETPAHVLRVLSCFPETAKRVRVLSKRDYRGLLSEMNSEMLVGVTITTLNESQKNIYQPGSSSASELIGTLVEANRKGYKTWLVIEPYFDGMNAFFLVKSFLPFLEEVWIGKLNHKDKKDYAVPDDSEIINHYKTLKEWASKNATQMKVRLKKQLLEQL